MNPQQIFADILEGDTRPFVMLQRTTAQGSDDIEILIGDTGTVDTLADIPLSDEITQSDAPSHDVFVLVPHRQIRERGFEAVQDESPLVVIKVRDQGRIRRDEALDLLPNDPITLANEGFDVENETYAGIVRDVLQNEIGTGEGSNFVIKRSFVAEVTDYSIRTAMSLFHRLLQRETGAYWTFIVRTGERTLVGATPERHVSLADGRAVMNPISGTYRYPPEGADLTKVLAFLDDRKETEELYMVLDEELKMMARICDGGGQVVGPFLREMAQLAHTEYYIEGDCTLDPREILRETLLAPTVTGSPLENACRVIAQYEPKGRGYYGGVAALIGHDANGTRTMDSAILIRTADFMHGEDRANMSVGVGATLVRHSDAQSEVAETHTKAAGVLNALKAPPVRTSGAEPKAARLQASRHPKTQAAP
jgi:phenazine biosynthesis protein phzE